MKAEIKNKWVKALRSGKYKQGKGRLKNGNAQGTYFCCLGVLADICGRTISEVSKEKGTFLSNSFLEEVGLTQGQQSDLAELNDDGCPFETIAVHIEQRI